MRPGKSADDGSGQSPAGAVLPDGVPDPARRRRRIYVTSGVAVVVLVGLALSFGPIVRWAVARRADGAGLDVDVAQVRPGFGAVHLLGVRARPRSLGDVAVGLDHVAVRI